MIKLSASSIKVLGGIARIESSEFEQSVLKILLNKLEKIKSDELYEDEQALKEINWEIQASSNQLVKNIAFIEIAKMLLEILDRITKDE